MNIPRLEIIGSGDNKKIDQMIDPGDAPAAGQGIRRYFRNRNGFKLVLNVSAKVSYRLSLRPGRDSREQQRSF